MDANIRCSRDYIVVSNEIQNDRKARMPNALKVYLQLTQRLRLARALAALRTHNIARHLLHQNARVTLGELAALQKVHLLKARAGHERVRADLLLERKAERDGALDGLDLADRDGLRERENEMRNSLVVWERRGVSRNGCK